MFRKGRRKTACLRGTAGLGVVLMLAGLVRPAFGMVSGAIGRPPPKAIPETFRPPAPEATPPPAARPPAERVRTAIVPTALRVESAAGADSAFGTLHAWALFDGDGATPLETSEAVRIR